MPSTAFGAADFKVFEVTGFAPAHERDPRAHPPEAARCSASDSCPRWAGPSGPRPSPTWPGTPGAR